MIREENYLRSMKGLRVSYSYFGNWCWSSFEVSEAHSAFHWFIPGFSEDIRSGISNCFNIVAC